MKQNISIINHVYVFFIDDFEELQEDIYPTFDDDDDDYEDDYFHELYKKDDWVFTLGFLRYFLPLRDDTNTFYTVAKEKKQVFLFYSPITFSLILLQKLNVS